MQQEVIGCWKKIIKFVKTIAKGALEKNLLDILAFDKIRISIKFKEDMIVLGKLSY